MDFNTISDILSSTIRVATPMTLMALGGLLCQRAGVFNIALEGFSLIGAFAGIAVVQISGGSVYMGMLGAIIAGILYSCIYALFVTRFKANHIISSIAMNMLGLGLTSFLLRTLFNAQGRLAPDVINKLAPIDIPILKDIPILNCLSGHSVVTYVTILLVVLCYIMLFKTKFGLSVCAVGESESAATTAGIKPNRVKWKVILMSGALCGLAGAYLSTVIVSQFSENMVAGRGFTAFTAFAFGNAHPIWTTLVTLLFGVAEAICIRIELAGMALSPSIIKMFPYVLAIIALTMSSYSTRLKTSGVLGRRKKDRLK
ncbi:MAG: ABC transporter permease [Oscillospiraceae bacterium]